MCLQPIKIKNVNYKSTNPLLLALKRDTEHAYMEVPCGRCEQCVAAKQSDFVQRIQSESKYNHLFFATLTYDNEHLPRLIIEVPVVKHSDDHSQLDSSLGSSSYSDCLDMPLDLVPVDVCLSRDSDEYLSLSAFDTPADSADDPEAGSYLDEGIEYKPVTFAYADIHDIQLLLKNVRDNLSDFSLLAGRCLRYAAVSELGKQNGRPHFHILFLLEQRPEDFDSLGCPDKGTLRSIEAQLRTIVRKYWAANIGTRKNPVYQPRFKYARKWSFGKMYTNYDLHWVDPSLTKDMTANVAYYVSKYMMKGSDRDAHRQQFLRLNLDEDSYRDVWSVIKCRMTCSKGLGLDARFEYIEKEETYTIYKPLDQYAKELDAYLASCDDLPDPDAVSNILRTEHRVIRRRIMVPNFELSEKIRRELTSDLGKAPGPVFIDPLGNHRPLSHYYQRFGYIFMPLDAVAIVAEYQGPEKEPPTKVEADQAAMRLEKRRRIADVHSPFDNVSTIDMPEDDPTLATYIY